jgi:ubiquinone/menaquinone biosynthesis C-methylase UbiE
MALDVQGFKQAQRRTWSAGDYAELARMIESAAEHLVRAADVQAGRDVLDVATGSGNVALVAAVKGANVTGLDLTPELFVAARRRAGEAGVECEWIEGDAEALPHADDSFDHTLSAFGAMFAPRHEVAAAELVRVTKPGGTVAVAAWTPEGINGQMFKTVGSHMPPPPPELKPPSMWGDEQYMRSLFEPLGVELYFELGVVEFEHDSIDSWLAYGEEKLGPMVMARAALEPQGKWEALRSDMRALYERENMNSDGSFHVEPEYLITVARLPG